MRPVHLQEATNVGKSVPLRQGRKQRNATSVNRVAFLLNPATATYAESYLDAFKAAAASVVVEATVAPIHDGSEFDTVIVGALPNW
jgi:hypothetical protein